jgi:hypothetical protein
MGHIHLLCVYHAEGRLKARHLQASVGHGFRKDSLHFIGKKAEAMGVPMVVGAAVRQMLAVTNATYGPDSDFTSICKVVEDWGGVKVRKITAKKAVKKVTKKAKVVKA